MSPLLLVALLAGSAAAATTDGSKGGASHWLPQEMDDTPFCYPFNYSCGPIPPNVPMSYEAHVEHVDIVYDITHFIEEFYDLKGNVLAVMDASASLFTHTIFYYDLNVAVLMSRDRGKEGDRHSTTCTVAEISHDNLYHPFPGVNETVHLVLAPSQALLFGNNYRYSYVENGTERWIMCNRWDACITGNKGSFNVEYYWSDPSFILDMYGFTNERPVKMRMTGHAEPPQGSIKPIQIDSQYSFGLFDDNPKSNIRWTFEITNGVYCEGLPSTKPPPSRLASAYSMRVEVTLRAGKSHHEYATTVRNWYDFYRRITRVDSMTNPATMEFAVAGLAQTAIIRDFRAGVEYLIDKSLGNCTTMPLTGSGYDTITTPDGNYAIKDPLLLFGLGGAGNLTYHGVKYARGLPCDVWVGHLDFDTDNGTIHNAYIYELYFLQAGWSEDAGLQEEEQFPVPLLISVHQDLSADLLPEDVIINLHQNIFKYEEEEPYMSVFDITPCFSGHQHIRRFQMAFPGSFRQDYNNNPKQFITDIHDSLPVFLQIPSIRLQHVTVEFSEVEERLFCEFTLVDQPQVDVELPQYVGKPLDTVVELLKASMDSIVILIVDVDGLPKLMRPIKDSLKEMFEEGCYSRDAPDLPLDDPDAPQPHPDAVSYYDDQPEREDVGGEGGSSNAEGSVSSFSADVLRSTRSDDGKMYTPGDMAGMSMGMLVLGLLLGTAVMLVILRKMGLSNDMELIPMNSRRQ